MSAEIILLRDDITKLDVDAIVNAANSGLSGGGGVDGAIHRAGGRAILDACLQIVAEQGPCATGQAVVTTAGKLPAKYVFHTVGPVWRDGTRNEAELLASCYRNCLRLADEKKLQSIAFPNISTGIYGFPKEKAAVIAINTVKEFELTSGSAMRVYFVCFDAENFSIYRKLLS